MKFFTFLNRRNKNKDLGNNEKNGLKIKELFKEVKADKKEFFKIFFNSKTFYNKIDNRLYTRYFNYNNFNVIEIFDGEKQYFNIVNAKDLKDLEKQAEIISKEILEINIKMLRSISYN